jgi:hypothetical protein
MLKSGFPLWKSRLQYGWRTVTLAWVRKYLEREWDGNRQRTFDFIRELQKKIVRKRSRAPLLEEPASKKSKSATTKKNKDKQPAASKKSKSATTKKNKGKQPAASKKSKSATTKKPFPLLAEARQQTQLLKAHTSMMADLVGGLLQVCKTMADRLATIETSTKVNADETHRLKDV